jgi:hypothetical protein
LNGVGAMDHKTYTSNLWKYLSPRERIIQLHLSNSPFAYKDWDEFTEKEQETIITMAKIFCILAPPDPLQFAASKVAKVETH